MMMSSSDNSSISFGVPSRSEYEEFCAKMSGDFVSKLQIDGADEGLQRRELEDETSEQDSRDSFESAVSDQRREEEGEGEGEGEDEDDDDEFEFSFAGVDTDGSPISADDVFQDGQIRPIYPLFDRSLLSDDSLGGEASKSTEEASHPRPPLKKLFVEMAGPGELDGVVEGTYCVWNGRAVEEAEPPEGCQKSSSTGFSRRWRFRDLVRRSNSDGKDAFVFLSTHRAHGSGGKAHEAKRDEESINHEKVGRTAVRKESKTATAKGQTAHEKHYVRNRAAKESDRRKSYLPYRQDLVGLGFFTNVNGMTRNVHPF